MTYIYSEDITLNRITIITIIMIACLILFIWSIRGILINRFFDTYNSVSRYIFNKNTYRLKFR